MELLSSNPLKSQCEGGEELNFDSVSTAVSTGLYLVWLGREIGTFIYTIFIKGTRGYRILVLSTL